MTTPHHTTPFRRRLGASLALAALLATACGASTAVTEVAADRAVAAPAASEAPSVAAGTAADPATNESAAAATSTDPATTGPATETSAAQSAGGHAYGLSIEEYGQSVRESGGATGSAQPSPDATTIGWADLIPEGATAEDVFARFETRLEEVEIGSPEATALYQEMQAEFDPGAVNTGLDGEKIWLAGFVAPLTYDDDIITEFLLVPSFGACIHVPPPPPNQTILVSVAKEDGLTFEDAWGAVWVEGTMTLEYATTDLAEASYTITSAISGVYNNF